MTRWVIGSVSVACVCGLSYTLWTRTTDIEVERNARNSPVDRPVVDNDTTHEDSFTAPEFAGLDDEKQTRIWELEHYTFELEWKFGKSFTESLQQRDRQALVQFFQESFSGSLPKDAPETIEQAWWTQTRSDSEVDPPSGDQDAVGLITHLLSYLEDFSLISRISFRVQEIDREGSGDLWRVRWLLSAFGETVQGGPISWESTHSTFCRFSNDQEIAAGKILTRWVVESAIIRSAPRRFMNEVTEQVGLRGLQLRDNWEHHGEPARQFTIQVAVTDFDRDGDLDMAVAGHDGRQYILSSLGGQSFEDATARLGFPDYRPGRTSQLTTWIDYNNDSYPDLVLGDRLYRNLEGKGFANETTRSGMRFNAQGVIVGSVVADYDCDGWLDLYVLYKSSPTRSPSGTVGYLNDNHSGTANQLWRNTGEGGFVDMTSESGVSAGLRNSFAAAWLHANDDHFPDLYVANDFGVNQLYLNDGSGHFQDVAEKSGVGDFATSMGVAVGDIDGNGETEIYVANMFSKMGRRIIDHVSDEDYPEGVFEQIQGACAGNRLYQLKSGRRGYRDISEQLGVNPVGWAFAPAMADFDADGFLDIYATTGFMSFNRKKPDG